MTFDGRDQGKRLDGRALTEKILGHQLRVPVFWIKRVAKFLKACIFLFVFLRLLSVVCL